MKIRLLFKIPLKEFDPLTVSFTYGDSFAIFNPALFGEEEYWNKVYFADEILDVVAVCEERQSARLSCLF